MGRKERLRGEAMSIYTKIGASCDGCHRDADLLDPLSVEGVIDQLEEMGWTVMGDQVFCPDCQPDEEDES